MGMSLLEISHRSAEYEKVVADAVAIVKELLGVPDGYKVLFLQGLRPQPRGPRTTWVRYTWRQHSAGEIRSSRLPAGRQEGSNEKDSSGTSVSEGDNTSGKATP
jgi:hypothetical protein